MGTNFYWLAEHQKPENITLPNGQEVWRGSGLDDLDPAYHLGKRSGAGLYCWDCGVTLCADGEMAVHHTRWGGRATKWLKACPKCGKTQQDQYPTRFDKITEVPPSDPKAAPTGVESSCSFTWAQDRNAALQLLAECLDVPLVENEYGEIFTGQEFLDLLRTSCPIHYLDSIGTRFS